MKLPPKHSRASIRIDERGVLALSDLAVYAAIGSFGLQVWDKLRQFDRERRSALLRERTRLREQEEVRTLRTRLFGTWESDNQIVFPSQTLAHLRPPLRGIYPQDGEALWNLAAAYEARGAIPEWTDALPSMDVARNLCSIGSPSSNVAARTAMGFRSDIADLQQGSSSNLRFNFDYSRIGEPPVFRYEQAEAGGECMLWDAKRYAIRDREGQLGVDGLLMPVIDADRFLRADLLLVSVLPPIGSANASKDARHVILAGAHSGGTKAAGLVLSNIEHLRQIDRGRKQSRYFQSLFRIPVDPGNTTRSTTPLEVEHLATVPASL